MEAQTSEQYATAGETSNCSMSQNAAVDGVLLPQLYWNIYTNIKHVAVACNIAKNGRTELVIVNRVIDNGVINIYFQTLTCTLASEYQIITVINQSRCSYGIV